jgi:hypothetical protein
VNSMAVRLVSLLALLTVGHAISGGPIFRRTNLIERVVASEGAVAKAGIDWQSGGPGVTWGSNCDFYGYDIYQVSEAGQYCGGTCWNDPQCTHFAWSNNVCYIKHANVYLVATSPGAQVCGWVTRSSPAPAPSSPAPSGVYTSGSPIWATWYCSLSNPGQYSACGNGNPAVGDCGNVNVYGLPGSAQGIAANNPLAFTNGGSTTCHWNGATCGVCYNLSGPAGSRKIVVSDCCAGYPGNTQCTAPNPPGNCDWCAANSNWHFDLDVDSFIAVCGNLDAGSCQLNSATPTGC